MLCCKAGGCGVGLQAIWGGPGYVYGGRLPTELPDPGTGSPVEPDAPARLLRPFASGECSTERGLAQAQADYIDACRSVREIGCARR